MTRAVSVSTVVDGETIEAGTATFVEDRVFYTSFRYSIDYLSHPGGYELEPGLTLDEGAHTFMGRLPLAFDDASPDLWGRRLLEDQRSLDRIDRPDLPAGLTAADYLLGASDETRQGALRFEPGEGGGRDVPASLELDELLAAADAVVAEDEDGAEGVKTLLDAGTGALGGALPKASVRDRDALWIAKFPMLGDRFSRAVWEKTALDLTEAMGVTVPERRIIHLGERPVLLVRRFDREGLQRVPYISARTLVQDVSGTESADYVDVANALRAEGTRPVSDLRALFRHALAVALVNDTENHLRNLGFLREGRGWVLAPAFDVNPNRDGGAARATAVAGSRYPRDTGRGLLALAKACGLARDEARDLVAAAVEVTSSWKGVAEANGARGVEIDRFTEAFDVVTEAVRSDVLA